jgi:hypothetical protein
MDSGKASRETLILLDMGHTFMADCASKITSLRDGAHARLAANVLVLFHIEFDCKECGIWERAHASQPIGHLFTQYLWIQQQQTHTHIYAII